MQSKRQPERRPLSGMRGDGYLTVVQLSNMLDDRKAETGSAQRTAAVPVDAIETLEKPALTFFRNANAMIGDRNLCPAVGTFSNGYFDGSRAAVTNRVLNEIRDRRLDQPRITRTDKR